MIPLAVLGAINTYSRQPLYNTLIEGVGASISNETDLAFKLNNTTLVAGDISYFLNDGTDVYARIDKTYTIKSYAWVNATDILAFYDFEGMVLRVDRNCFAGSTIVYAEFPECTEFNSQQQFSACPDLIWCRAPKLENLNYRTFYQCAEMIEAIYPLVTSITTHTTMSGCHKNVTVDLGSWDGITGGNTSTIAYNYALQNLNIDSMTNMPSNFMRNATSITRVDAPELVAIGTGGMKLNSLLTTFYAPKLETLGSASLQQCAVLNVPPSIKYLTADSAFYLVNSVPMIALPELTSPIGTSVAVNGNNFRTCNNGSLGCTLIVPLVHETSNAGGEDADIVNFRTYAVAQDVKYNLGDIAINGDFTTDTDWVYSGTAFSISGGLLNCTGAGASDSATLETLLTIGVEYLVVLDLKETNGGDLICKSGSNSVSVDTAETGTKTFLITCATSTDFLFENNSADDFIGSIDDLKIYPIN